VGEKKVQLAMILMGSTSGLEAIQQSMAYRRALDPHFSLAFLAKRLGLKSRGSLSEMLRGKKPIPLRLRRQIFSVLFKDDESLIDYADTLLARDEAKPGAEKDRHDARLWQIASYLNDRFTQIQLDRSFTLFASDVLCAFDLFGGHPSERQLIDFFGKQDFQAVRRALQALLQNELISVQGGVYSRTERTKRFITLDHDVDPTRSFLKESIQHALQEIPRKGEDVASKCFGSTTMSVKREDYLRVLEAIRRDVFKYFSQLETAEGDMMIRFNMQIYPIAQLKSPDC